MLSSASTMILLTLVSIPPLMAFVTNTTGSAFMKTFDNIEKPVTNANLMQHSHLSPNENSNPFHHHKTPGITVELNKSRIPETTTYDRSTHFSEESKNVSVHKVDHTPNPLTYKENQILQDSNALISKDPARVMDLENSNLPPSDYPSEPHSQVQPKVLHEISSTVKSNITSSVKDTVSSNPYKPRMSPPYFLNSSTANRTSSVTGENQFHSLNSPAKARFNDNKTPHLSTSSATNEFFHRPTVNRSAFRPPLNSPNSSTTSPTAPMNPSQSLTTAKDRLIQNTNSNKSMSKSSTHFSGRSENVSMAQTDHTLNCQSGIPIVLPDSLKEFSPKRSQPNLSYTTNKYSINLQKGSENAQMTKTVHTPTNLLQDQIGITSVASDSSKELSSKRSQPYPSNTTNKNTANLPNRSENAQMAKTDHTPNSLAHDQSGITSVATDSSKEFSSKRSLPNLDALTSADVVAVPFSGKLKDAVNSNSIKIQMSQPFPNSSTAHQSSSMLNTSSPNSPTSVKDRYIRNTIKDNSPTHISGKSETVSISKTDHTLNSLTFNKGGIPRVIPDSSKDFFSDEWSVNLPKGITPLPSQVLCEVSHEDTLIMNSNLTALGSLKDTVSSDTDKLQESTSNVHIPSTTHQTSSMKHKKLSYFTTNEERLSQNASGNKSMNISRVPSPTSLDKITLPQTTGYNRSTHLPDNVSFHKADHTPDDKDSENGLPSQFLNNLTCSTNVDDVQFSDMDSDSFIHTLQGSNARFDKDSNKFRVIDLENSNLPPSDYAPEPLHSQFLCEVLHEKSPSMNLNVTPPDNLETVNLRATKPQMSPPFFPNSSTENHTSAMTEDRNLISPVTHKVNASYSPNSSAKDKPIINPYVFLNKPQNYEATRIIRHKPPSPSPSRSPSSFLINNLKDPKWHSGMKGYESSSSVTSRSHHRKLKQQPDSPYSSKIQYKELYFDCVDNISKPENIDSDRYLSKPTEVSNSFEAAKEFPRSEYKLLFFTVNKLFNFIIAIIRIFVSLIILFYRKIRS